MGEMNEMIPYTLTTPHPLDELCRLAGPAGSVVLSRAPHHDTFGVEVECQPPVAEPEGPQNALVAVV